MLLPTGVLVPAAWVDRETRSTAVPAKPPGLINQLCLHVCYVSVACVLLASA